MFKLPQKIIDDIQRYKENLEDFLLGKSKDTFFRAIRVPWGNYSQRGGKLLMSRLRVPAGILTSRQLNAIATAAKKFADGKLHLTTRQDIQIHNVAFENSIKIIEYLKDFDISPRGGGGNTVRNITACYLSGVCPDENIEVHNIACGLSEYLLAFDEAYNLPRKFKIAFSGCKKDCANTGVNDVGILALNGNFKVICGGGMGANSMVGRVLHEDLKYEEIGYVVKAIMNVFGKYGNRKNRHHNRLRFLIQDTGWEKFVELYNQELKNLKDNEHIVLRIEDNLLQPQKQFVLDKEEKSLRESNKDYNLFLKYNTCTQKQMGYSCIELRIPYGEINSDTLISLSQIGEILPSINFRTTHRQNLVISNVPGNKIYFVYEKINSFLKDYLFPGTALDMICCKAATTCNLGICNALGLAPEIVSKLKNPNLDIDKLKDLKINMNGCPNACAQHPLGTISLSGVAKKVYNRTVPFYKVYLGGKVDAENTKLAEEIGIVPARVVPKLLYDFILSIQKNTDKQNRIFLMKDLIKKYSFVPTYEEDKSYYIDFGRTEEFSLDGLTQGECGAGVIDMINSDIESAGQSLNNAKENDFDLDEIKNTLIYSARALLPVKGVDPKDEKTIVAAFVDKFVKTGICSIEFEDLSKFYNDILLGKINKEEAYEYLQKFYKEVKKIYSSMDDNFKFSAKLTPASGDLPKDNSMLYDLRGTPCPINYVKIKLKLEELNIGDVLEVYLDEGEPIQNVPTSLQNDKQEILKIEPIKNFFKIIIKKKI